MPDRSALTDDELLRFVWASSEATMNPYNELRRRLSEKDAECKAYESLRGELARLFGEQKPHPQRTFNEQILRSIGDTLTAKDAEIAVLLRDRSAQEVTLFACARLLGDDMPKWEPRPVREIGCERCASLDVSAAEREVERLREALTEIVRFEVDPMDDAGYCFAQVRKIARAALSVSEPADGPGCDRHAGDPHNLCEKCWENEPADEGAFGREVARQATHIKLPDGKVLRKPAASTEGGQDA